uniref:Nonsense-mediated mRNA decay factor SMG8 n=1 Tax=Ditylenchus dipsaci TaxID=166011 RepID=A0A915DNK7_9BILA
MKSNSSSARSKEYVYEFPRLKNFIVAAKLLYKKLITERDFDFTHVVQKINAEVLVQENSTDANMQNALDIYEQHLKTPAASSLAFSQLEHDEKLQQAIRYLSGREVSGERLNRLIRSLTKQCTAIWNDGHQRCEMISLTGHQCALPIHETEGKSYPNAHSTGFQLLSTCNCGKSQAIRLDPFTHKQANYDFYQQACFECCTKGEKFELPVFQPECLEISEDLGESEDEITGAGKGEEDYAQEGSSYELNLQQTLSPPRTAEEEETEQMTNHFSAHFYDNNQAVYKLAGNGSGKSSHNDNENTSDLEEQSDYKTASASVSEQSFSGQEEEAESEEEEEVRRKKLSQPNSASEESEEDENNEEALSTQHSLSTNNSRKKGTLQNRKEHDRRAFLLPAKKEAHYLDDYDVHLTTNRAIASPIPASTNTLTNKSHKEASNELIKSRKNVHTSTKVAEKYKGEYLDHMAFTQSDYPDSLAVAEVPRFLPLFPSWSLICLGPSSLYNHSSGIRSQPNFKAGSEYLLPWDVRFTVDSEQWKTDMESLAQQSGMGKTTNIASSHRRHKRNAEESWNPVFGSTREKVKIFVGFDYECPRGHRFMVQAANKPLRHRRMNGPVAVDASELLSSSQPIWMPCTCRREPKQLAQLMHIHVVTPKAPVTVILGPRVQIENQKGGISTWAQMRLMVPA